MPNLFFSGWITGHTYVTYGPLLNGATSVIFEGIPFYPSNDRCWQIVQKYKVIMSKSRNIGYSKVQAQHKSLH